MKNNAGFNKNNLDLLRLILAVYVFLFHISALTNIATFTVFGLYLSPHFAVRSFFVISGLLIYRSYTRSSSVASYFDKRFRRIYPAYFSVIVISAIALFPLSSLPFLKYFGLDFCRYVGANLLFLNFLAPSLPGLFTTANISSVNGALWTLKIEVAFYLFVPLMHFLSLRLGTKKVIGTIFIFSYAWKFGFAFLGAIARSSDIHPIDQRNMFEKLEVQFPAQLVYFCAGILLLLFFDKLRQHFRSISCISACLFLIDHWFMGGNLDVLWISGFVFVFGFWGYMGNFSKYGDFSYGVYIVHWPILQTMIAFGLATHNPYIFLLLSIFLVGSASILMWNLVERRFLMSSSHYTVGP